MILKTNFSHSHFLFFFFSLLAWQEFSRLKTETESRAPLNWEGSSWDKTVRSCVLSPQALKINFDFPLSLSLASKNKKLSIQFNFISSGWDNLRSQVGQLAETENRLPNSSNRSSSVSVKVAGCFVYYVNKTNRLMARDSFGAFSQSALATHTQ